VADEVKQQTFSILSSFSLWFVVDSIWSRVMRLGFDIYAQGAHGADMIPHHI
jgi:hypothetical protein